MSLKYLLYSFFTFTTAFWATAAASRERDDITNLKFINIMKTSAAHQLTDLRFLEKDNLLKLLLNAGSPAFSGFDCQALLFSDKEAR